MTVIANSPVTLHDALVKLEQEIVAAAQHDDVNPDDVLLFIDDACIALRCSMRALPVRIQLIAKDAHARNKVSRDSGCRVIKFSAKILRSQIERTICAR